MTETSFRFAPDILRRLGEELNPSIDQGVLELVKNAYDADARHCSVHIGAGVRGEGLITVSDDGDGLTERGIIDGWLVLGRSRKLTSRRTRLGRIPAGNKGLGRLAALRLGRSAMLVTRPRDAEIELTVSIEWDRYDHATLVEDVMIPVIERPLSEGASNGTDIAIRGLRNRVGRMDVKRLARSLILLADPFGDDERGFSPVLEAPEYSDLERLVTDRYFNDADYHLIAHLKDGIASANVVDWRGESLFTGSHADIATSRDGAKYRTPDASYDLWAYILTAQSFSVRNVTLGEVKTWIEAFGGVHLYLNGLRVSPYGNPGNDWLDLNLRRAQSPEERPSTNTSIGRVSIEDTKGLLTQKTDRSGFIETPAFEELRSFAQDASEWMARVRLQAAEARRRRERTASPSRSETSRQDLTQQIQKAPKTVRKGLQEAFQKYDRARQRETDALRREVQLYRTLSTAGITAATFAHESAGNPIKVISQAINAIEFRAKRAMADSYDKSMGPPVESIKKAADALAVLSSATLRLVDSDKRRVGRVSLNTVVKQIIETFEPFFVGREVNVRIALSPGDPFLRGSEAAIESIVTNFINNSMAALEATVEAERVILIETDVIEDTWRLTVADSGTGLVGISDKAIWLPGETRRSNGTGLGLTIVRDAVADLSGSVSVQAHGHLGGATFTVELPILGV
jgi:signal transduction histidine kinase